MKKFITLILLWLPAAAFAHDGAETIFNLISLQAQVTREAPNDLLQAVLSVDMEDRDPTKLADRANRTMQDALKTAAAFKTVKVKSGNYQTYPVYDKTHITHWRMRQELKLESKDFEAATALIAKLQGALQLGNMDFSVAPETQRAVENSLITEAIQAFSARADIVRAALKAHSYKVKELQINTGQGNSRPMLARQLMSKSAEIVSAPGVEAGTSQVSVNVTGSIKLD